MEYTGTPGGQWAGDEAQPVMEPLSVIEAKRIQGPKSCHRAPEQRAALLALGLPLDTDTGEPEAYSWTHGGALENSVYVFSEADAATANIQPKVQP